MHIQKWACELTEASIVCEKLYKSLTLRPAVPAAAAVAPRRQAYTQWSHVVGRHHRTCKTKGEKMSMVTKLPRLFGANEAFLSFFFSFFSTAEQQAAIATQPRHSFILR